MTVEPRSFAVDEGVIDVSQTPCKCRCPTRNNSEEPNAMSRYETPSDGTHDSRFKHEIGPPTMSQNEC